MGMKKRHSAVKFRDGLWPLCWVKRGVWTNGIYKLAFEDSDITCKNCLKIKDSK